MIIGKEIIENSPLAMATTEGPGHMLLFVSPAFCALQGKTADEIVGHPMSEAISGGGAQDILALLDGIYGGGKSGFVNHRQYSEPGHVLNSKSYTAWGLSAPNGHEDGLVIQVSDAAEARQANERDADAGIRELNREIREINEQLVLSSVHQQTLAEMAASSELRLRGLIQGLNAIICEIDARTGTFTFVSEPAESFLGYPLKRWNEDGFWKRIIHADDYETASAALLTEGLAGEDLQYTFRVTAADGSEIWLRNIVKAVRNADGAIVKRRCVIVDATRQQSDHQALVAELERNRSIAEAMQYSILWQQPEKLFPGLSVAAFYEPAAGDALVGGDFFDAFKLPDQSIMLLVGDVTGKGLKAATRTVEVIFALRAFAQDYKDPAETMGRLNRFICDFHRDEDEGFANALVVLSLIVVNPATGVTHVVSAGAEPPLIVRAAGSVEEISVQGLILGIDRDTSYGTREISLDAGDTLLITTDGITEARRGRDFFGYERLLETARRAAGAGTPRDTGQAVLDAAHAYTGGRLTDDMCLLVVRREGI